MFPQHTSSLSEQAVTTLPAAALIASAPFNPSSINLVTIAIVLLGILFGAMWRAADIMNKGGNWLTVRHDLFISCLAGGANAIMALGIIQYIQTGAVLSLVIAMLVGATGVRGVQWAYKIATSMLADRLGANTPKAPTDIT